MKNMKIIMLFIVLFSTLSVIAFAKNDNKKINGQLDNTNVNKVDATGMNILFVTLLQQNKKKYKNLLEQGADPNIKVTKVGKFKGQSVVSLSAQSDTAYYLELALKYGGNPNIIDINKFIKPTPIFNAIMTNRINNVEILINAGANINYQNGFKNTPLIEAIKINQYDIAFLLLKANADYNINKDKIVKLIENYPIDTKGEQYKWRAKVIKFIGTKGIIIKPKF
jgi:ankyrin repeat protein